PGCRARSRRAPGSAGPDAGVPVSAAASRARVDIELVSMSHLCSRGLQPALRAAPFVLRRGLKPATTQGRLLDSATLQRIVDGAHDLIDGDLAIVIGVAGGARRIAGAEIQVHHDENLVDGNFLIAVAVADAAGGSGRRWGCGLSRARGDRGGCGRDGR